MPESVEERAPGFPPGAPDVRLGGLLTIRSTIRQDPESPEAGEADEQRINWHIYGVPTSDEREPLFLFGDLEATHGSWFVGTTVFSPVVVRAPGILKAADDIEAEAVARILGPWASDVLYDFAAAILRPLVAVTLGCSIELPNWTPEVHIASARSEPGQEAPGEGAEQARIEGDAGEPVPGGE